MAGGVRAYQDGGVRGQPLGVQDEEDDLDEAQRGFDYLPGARGQQQADVVQQLLQGVDLDGVCKRGEGHSEQEWGRERSQQAGESLENHWRITGGSLQSPLYSKTSRVKASTVQVIMVTEPVSPAYTSTKYSSMASETQQGAALQLQFYWNS